MIVYHYTPEESYNEIMRAKEFKPSLFSTALDAAYGEGWYFTDLDPSVPDSELYYNLWRQSVPERVKRYLVFDIDHSLLQNTRAHVYRLALDSLREAIIRLNMQYRLGNNAVIKFIRGGIRSRDYYKNLDYHPLAESHRDWEVGVAVESPTREVHIRCKPDHFDRTKAIPFKGG